MNAPASPPRLAGFEYQRVDVEGVTVNCAVQGSGPPLLLLHGYPENHLMWRHVAPVLAEDHTVVVADLRGYGDSGKPAPDPAMLVYAKRSMARDQAGLMRQLGFSEFGLIGHDRGARVAHRLVLGHPGAVPLVLPARADRHPRAPDRRRSRLLGPVPDRPAARPGREHRAAHHG